MAIMSEQTGLEIIEASAKNSIKINEVMETITRKLIENRIKGGNNNINNNTPNKGVNLDNKNNNKTNSGCC